MGEAVLARRGGRQGWLRRALPVCLDRRFELRCRDAARADRLIAGPGVEALLIGRMDPDHHRVAIVQQQDGTAGLPCAASQRCAIMPEAGASIAASQPRCTESM